MIQINCFIRESGNPAGGWYGFTKVEGSVFKDGCPNPKLNDKQIQQVEVAEKVTLKAFITDMTEMFALILTVDAVRRISPDVTLNLSLPYLPYARQDRVCNEGEANGISAFARVLNSLEFSAVLIHDPHSDVAAGSIARCMTANMAQFMAQQKAMGWMDFSQTWFIAPDAGAVKRVKGLAKKLGAAGVITATKERDTATMELTKTVFDEDPTGKNLLVIDDICDGGRTFIALAQAIRELGTPESLRLWVTHGIFSYGTEVVTEHYDGVYTTNSYRPYAYGHTDGAGNVNPKMHWISI